MFFAGTPSRIRCPHCKTRLRYVGIRRLLWILVLAGVLVFGCSFVFVQYIFRIENEDKRMVIGMALFFASWAVVELVVALYLRRNKVLECIP